MGECDKETTFGILDHFCDNGGNFIDTANNYQNEESEKWIGEWMEDRGVRDQMVIATKVWLPVEAMFAERTNTDVQMQFTTNYNSSGDPKTIKSNYTGNNTKSMFLSVEASLKKLKTSYIDIVRLPRRC